MTVFDIKKHPVLELNSVNQDIEDEFEPEIIENCSICMEQKITFNDINLPECQHVLCRDCLFAIINKSNKCCPFCQKKFPLKWCRQLTKKYRVKMINEEGHTKRSKKSISMDVKLQVWYNSDNQNFFRGQIVFLLTDYFHRPILLCHAYYTRVLQGLFKLFKNVFKVIRLRVNYLSNFVKDFFFHSEKISLTNSS